MQPVSLQRLDNFPMGGKVLERCGTIVWFLEIKFGECAVGERASGWSVKPKIKLPTAQSKSLQGMPHLTKKCLTIPKPSKRSVNCAVGQLCGGSEAHKTTLDKPRGASPLGQFLFYLWVI